METRTSHSMCLQTSTQLKTTLKKLCYSRGTARHVLSVVQVTFKLTQSHWYSCHSIGHTQFPICLPLWLYDSILHLFGDIIVYFPKKFKRSHGNDHAHYGINYDPKTTDLVRPTTTSHAKGYCCAISSLRPIRNAENYSKCATDEITIGIKPQLQSFSSVAEHQAYSYDSDDALQ